MLAQLLLGSISFLILVEENDCISIKIIMDKDAIYNICDRSRKLHYYLLHMLQFLSHMSLTLNLLLICSFRLVIMSLVDLAQGKHRHVPYRDSRLTFLLQVR